MRFGVEHADVEPLGGGIGGQIAHAKHGQGEIVDPRTLRVVAQRRVDEQRVEAAGVINAGDQGRGRCTARRLRLCLA